MNSATNEQSFRSITQNWIFRNYRQQCKSACAENSRPNQNRGAGCISKRRGNGKGNLIRGGRRQEGKAKEATMKANRGETRAEDAAKIVGRFAEVSQTAIRVLDIAKAYRDWEIALRTDVELWSGEDGLPKLNDELLSRLTVISSTRARAVMDAERILRPNLKLSSAKAKPSHKCRRILKMLKIRTDRHNPDRRRPTAA